jgi:hypothetical protein
LTTLPTWALVLLGLAGPIAAVAALVVGWLRERSRQDHERKLQKAELEDRRQSQRREERHKAYTAFMAACDRLHEGDYSSEAMAEFRKTRALVWLVSSSTNVQDSAQELSNFVLVRQPQEEARREGEANRRKVEAGYGAVLRKLLNAAQRDLGIDPAEMQEPA